jgi:ABC-type sugar transport system permease subunit
MNHWARRTNFTLWIFAAAPTLFVLAVLFAPAVQGIVLSFGHGGPSVANYAAVLRDKFFWRAVAGNLIVPAGSLVVEFVVGLALALTLSARGGRIAAIADVAAILPFAIPEIVLLAIARYIFMPRGYLNGALGLVGVSPLPWLVPGSPLSFATVIVVDAWHVTPVVMLIIVAGLQTIPPELYEAARLDGAGTLATFRHITLPMLAPALLAALVLRGIDALRIFSTTLVLTGVEGVPVISTYAYHLWTDAQQPRMAMAASVILAGLIVVTAIAGLLTLRRSTVLNAAL